MSRRFFLQRNTDVTGVSGVGVVVEGVEFADGTVAMRWLDKGKPQSTVLHESIGAVEAIHGHDGATHVVWID